MVEFSWDNGATCNWVTPFSQNESFNQVNDDWPWGMFACNVYDEGMYILWPLWKALPHLVCTIAPLVSTLPSLPSSTPL